jgi:hypothetical protein
LVLGLALGGDWRRLQTLDLKFWPVLAAGAAARGLAPFLGALALASSIFGLVLIAVVAAVNWSLSGAWLIALGSALNAVVAIANGGMPVDPSLLTTAGKPVPADGLHVLLGPETRLPMLADILLMPVVNNIYSVGDVAIAIGGFWITFRLVRHR